MTPRAARGMALVAAIFLLVVLAALGTALMTVSGVQHASYAQQIAAARVHYAARAGLEWAAWQAIVDAPGGCPAGASAFTLDGIDLAVSCARTNHAVGAAVVPYYVVDVEARRGAWGNVDFAARSLQGKLAGSP